MKTKFILFSTFLAVLGSCGKAEREQTAAPLSEQVLKFEIYDSLVVDYLGNLLLMDISPDGKNYLMIDQNTDTIFVTNPEGEIQEKLFLKGEGPGLYKDSRWGLAKFISNQEFILSTGSSFYQFRNTGDLEEEYKMGFSVFSTLQITNGNNIQVLGDQVFANISGRDIDKWGAGGIDYQQNARHLEVLDLTTGEFEPAIKFPKSSKFSSADQAYFDLLYFRQLAVSKDSLFLAFRNEPKIYGYPINDFGQSPSIKTIPFETFIENEPKSDKVSDSFNMNDFFVGTINDIHHTEDQQFLINYLSGLSEEEFQKASAETDGDFNKIFEFAEKYNTGGFVLFDGSQLSPIIKKPEILGNLNKFVSKDEIWFSLNFSEAENDYSVIYKTRLVNP
ncbi:hypothetical protein [Algoriphagus hitonicola]|uniref:6-bladed beta-propeller protein n=1 Tax=Algoriphagus hitonicola TaxID=435880 RepID=A0A1I2VES0_9BACT|nr:hypothetical protein [Algoriphagus hitonicola]SFG85926.1 hypothetical protein SAMN04487988_10985 [Algoriphagus hitonicola]